MLIRTSNGHYLPSFFCIHIDSDDPLEECARLNEQTFAHEYLHFLQDLILPYCMRQTVIVLHRFSFIHKMTNESGKLNIPYSEWNEETNEFERLTSYTWGDDRFLHEVASIQSLDTEEFNLKSGQRVFKYTATTDSGITYQIGARDFLEYLAHKIENCYWPTQAPDFPYKTVDRIFDFFGLHDVPEEVRVCIIDYCLYNDNPMHHFMNIFIGQKLINDYPEKFRVYADCCEFLLNVGWNSHGGFRDNIFSKAERRMADLERWFDDRYGHEFYGDIRTWIRTVIEYSKEHFTQGLFISSLYGLEPSDFATKLKKIVDDIGIPFMSNRQNESGCMLPVGFNGNDFIQFHVLGKFMEYVESRKRQCSIFEICSASNPGAQKDECWYDPFLVARSIPNGGDICAFGAFLKVHDFDKVTVNYQPYAL